MCDIFAHGLLFLAVAGTPVLSPGLLETVCGDELVHEVALQDVPDLRVRVDENVAAFGRTNHGKKVQSSVRQ